MKFSTKNTVKFISTLSFGLLSLTMIAQEGQNLVPNGSFESVAKKVKRLGSIESATGWVSPTGVRADLFTDGNVEEISVPMNVYGKESPKDGSNYAGIVGFSYGNKLPRSYVMTKLEAPLKKGMRYCVKYHVSLAEASKYASNNMGVKLSKKPFGTDSKVSIIDEASVVHFNNDQKIMSARYNWTEICGTYESTGGEKFITLGNFDSNEDTKSERMKKDAKIKVTQSISAYYYIDDVSVVLLGDGESCDCQVDEGGDEYSSTIYQKTFVEKENMSATDKVEAQQVFFAFGKNKITQQGESSLDLIVEQLKANPEWKLQINGHNNKMEDEVGAENDYYTDMDNKRIGAVMEYLIEKGINNSQLIPTQKGSESPNEEVGESDDEDLIMAKSRRVTFKVRQ